MEQLSCNQINTKWAEVYRMLKSIGFKLYEPNDDSLPACFEADFMEEIKDDSNLIMLESEISRNMLCVILRSAGWFDIYVQDDIGCGWVDLPFRWSEIEIEIEWLTNLKKAFTGKGFNK